ncbi:syntaxin [Gymnopilus junonius]|uniref:Syntaxin n=1 Tax=Gymnopilus junonius TaxID=109634 RepID=A0A9P5P2F7_GYMJU|nr:syntaxin [Gymnopilus junonius]
MVNIKIRSCCVILLTTTTRSTGPSYGRSFNFSFPAMTAIQAVFIRGYEERNSPKPHTVYKIDIQAHVRSWQMWRRYSEFDDLHTELTKAVGALPPASLPPKHKFAILRSHNNTKILEERRAGLETYLRAIISAKEDKWRDTFAFKDFLGIPIGRQGTLDGSATSANQFTFATWLDEHAELQARLRDVWADINKRDALSDRGDVAAAHKSNVAAKSKLAGVLSRIGNLGKGLQELGLTGMSEGELQRRTDMVARLQDDCEKLSRVVTVARQGGLRSNGSTTAATINVASESDREALLGTAASKPARRVFGAPPKETEATRPLDNVGLLSMQQTQIQQQDSQLSQLTTILQRQRQLGEAINNEIALQNDLLDDLSNEVDRVGGKLHTANKNLNKLS